MDITGLEQIDKDWGPDISTSNSKSANITGGQWYLYCVNGQWHAGRALLYSQGWQLTGWHCGPVYLSSVSHVYKLPEPPTPFVPIVIGGAEEADDGE